MTLRKKVLSIIVLISILLISLINAASRLIILQGFSNLEEEYCVKNVQRAVNVFTKEKNSLLTQADDYAAWDDTYAFAADLNPDYVKSNILPGTFTSLNLNFFIFVNNSGQVFASYGYDLINEQSLDLPADLLDLIAKNQLFHDPDINNKLVGILQLKDGALLFAAHPILTSKYTGPPRGSLILGRYLSKDYASQLAEATQSSIQIDSYVGSTLSLELQTAIQVPDSEPPLFINVLSAESIAGYTVLTDVFDNPALILRAGMERDIYNHGYATILFFITVMFFGCLFFFIFAVILLDKQVISRITSLSKSVSRIRLSGTLVDRVPHKGKDEISSLARSINEMLQSLEVSDDELRQSRDELEKRVEARAAELIQVNTDLNYEISERKLGEQALYEAYNEIHLILSSISSMMIGVDSDRMVTQWNDVATRMLGLSSPDVTGLDFFTLPINWDWEKITPKVTECTKNNVKVRMDDILLGNPGDNPRILGITLTPLILKDKEQPGFLLVAADITERRLLEQQLGRSSKLEAIGQLAAGVAHEINTPTQLVGSNLRFLGQQLAPVLELIDKVYQLNRAVKNGTATPEMAIALEQVTAAAHLEYFRHEAPKAIEQSLEGIDRISHIVSAMRYFSHPGSEAKEMANLNQILQNALSLSRNEWKNVAEIKTDLDETLPAVECMPSELSQVVLNLIINAVHGIQDARGEEPEEKGQIVITSRQVEEFVEVRISDNGTGIPEEIRDKIFDPFFTTKEVGRGTGQGLAIAHTVIVTKHGGTIQFETELGRGTTFIIRLPRNKEND